MSYIKECGIYAQKFNSGKIPENNVDIEKIAYVDDNLYDIICDKIGQLQKENDKPIPYKKMITLKDKLQVIEIGDEKMSNNLIENNNEIIIYTTDDGQVDIEVRLEDENVWLTQNSMAELFDTTRNNITMHIKNIFEEGEF